MSQPAEVLKCVWHALQEMWFALVETAEPIRAECLHDAHVHVGVVVLHERSAIDGDKSRQAVEVMIEQFLAQRGRQVSLAVVEKRGNVILKRPFAPALVIQKKRLSIAEHHVARLKVAIEKEVMRGGEK